MFSGIVEKSKAVIDIEQKGTNLIFTIEKDFDEPLYIDQSISHNGVCLTVIDIQEDSYKVEAIKQTLEISNLGTLKVGDLVNLERCIQMKTRIDGHIVQGHVDSTAKCLSVKDENGSWLFTFQLEVGNDKFIIPKGSITINGISLTLANISGDKIQVAIIPYTYDNTNLHKVSPGDTVNIEFDMMGKYIVNYMEKIKA